MVGSVVQDDGGEEEVLGERCKGEWQEEMQGEEDDEG